MKNRRQISAIGVNLGAMVLLVMGGTLAGCQSGQLQPQVPPSPADSSETGGLSSTDGPDAALSVATVQEIVATPVSVVLGQSPPAPAQVGQGMAYGDQIRTADQALAEVRLATGPVFRIGGNAALTLSPDQKLQIDSGQIIAWVQRSSSGSPSGSPAGVVEIVTPAGIAGIRGTTVFIDIADDPNAPGESAPVEIFAWEGEVTFRPLNTSEEIVLTSGQQLLLQPGEQDVAALRQRVRPLTQAEAQQRLQESPLINGFSRPLPTRPQIEGVVNDL